MNVKKMKMQLMATAASVLISGIALTSATYAWYVANNTVEATTTKISATTNGFILQIATAEQGPQHGGEQTSLAASTTGGIISPSSTNNLINWYVCEGWNEEGKVTSYRKPTFVTMENQGSMARTIIHITHISKVNIFYIPLPKQGSQMFIWTHPKEVRLLYQQMERQLQTQSRNLCELVLQFRTSRKMQTTSILMMERKN